MKKIMFNDRYGLTQAVIGGRKTMTRRVMSQQPSGDLQCMSDEMNQDKITWTTRAHFTSGVEEKAQYYVGEIVAVAQCYSSIARLHEDVDSFVSQVAQAHECRIEDIQFSPGWSNKMYVCAEPMPHRIHITGVRAERLQDITDEECMREGIQVLDDRYYYRDNGGRIVDDFGNPRKAFASLIDKVSGKGTWDRNPWVWVYEFELVK